jgi:hypothetical protein
MMSESGRVPDALGSSPLSRDCSEDNNLVFLALIDETHSGAYRERKCTIARIRDRGFEMAAVRQCRWTYVAIKAGCLNKLDVLTSARMELIVSKKDWRKYIEEFVVSVCHHRDVDSMAAKNT